MKIIFLFLMFNSFSALAAPCGGASGKLHTNPDGKQGGFVATTASVGKAVFIDLTSEVCDQAKVLGNVKISSGSKIFGAATVEGNSQINSSRIYGIAKVSGSAFVQGSSVCQGSQINFKLVNSEYYCQSDDPEPKHPGAIGEKTILGVDSDTDGVRDDIEIWINNITSNTSEKDYYNHRMALKQIAKKFQDNVKSKDNRIVSVEIFKDVREAFNCLEDVSSAIESEELTSDFQIEFYNTMERLHAWAKLQGNMNGQMIKVEQKKKFATCQFPVKDL